MPALLYVRSKVREFPEAKVFPNPSDGLAKAKELSDKGVKFSCVTSCPLADTVMLVGEEDKATALVRT